MYSSKDYVDKIIHSGSAEAFLDAILECVVVDFHTAATDNFDKVRFPDRSASDIDTKKQAESIKWLNRHYQDLYQAFTVFEDSTSKTLFQQLIRYRICGHQHVTLQTNNPSYWQARDQTKEIPCIPSQFQYSGQFGTLDFCSFSWEGREVRLHTLQLALAWYMSYRQYYFQRGKTSIRPEQGDVVIDGGGCLGDSTVFFGLSAGENGKVYCFEFAAEHLEIIRENKKINNMGNIEVVPMGLSDRLTEGKPVPLGKIWPGNRISFHDQALPLTTLDFFVEERRIDKVDFIKLDIEGAELSCLKGARKTIERDRPRLAISLYHHPNDLFEIPLWIRTRFPDYQLYLDHYTIHEEETVLYGI